ncbi:hypothetical protein Taro_034643 [Colocasia esculenta]|uniref:SWI/SNF-related matrix-associated actin-dependent regulator of chromatin subfamily A member 3-like 3 n=1 Tax=Colocasia esculenta TaxID=4460 RepID=A0A843VRZ6_COLES|nr:hypothetical protein [Colocasia esculenta]
MNLLIRRAPSVYVNVFTGEATIQFPSATQMARGGVNAMGLGKTVMTIALILGNVGRDNDIMDGRYENARNQKRASEDTSTIRGGTLVVCPMALLGQWKDELEAHSEPGTISIFVHYGGDRTSHPRTIAKHDVVLTTYGVLSSAYKHESESIFHRIEWYRVVLDEAHTIKTSASLVAQSTFSLRAYCRWCLTGTPLQNSLEDLYSLLRFLHVEPWCNWVWWYKLVQKPYEEGDERGLKLIKGILKPLMLRRTKETRDKDGRYFPISALVLHRRELLINFFSNLRIAEESCLADIIEFCFRPILVLPPIDIQMIECEQSEAERLFYDILFRKSKVKFEQFAAEGKVLQNYASILELLLRLRQCCNHPLLVTRKQKGSIFVLFIFPSDQKICVCELCSRADAQQSADLDRIARDLASCPAATPAFVEEVVEGIRRGDVSECPICFESASDDPVLTPCMHRMCRECLLSSWQTVSGGPCPICRRAFTQKDLRVLPGVGRLWTDVEGNWKDSSKVAKLLDCLEKIRRSGRGEKSIIFSQWTCFLDLLEIPLQSRGLGFLRYDGKLSQKQRETVLKEFSESKETTVMLMSLKAGGVGLNLTAASNVFIMDPWWNPAVEEQAIMRIHRIGQPRPVRVRRFIVEGTVEERLQQVQARKQRMIEGALTDEEVRTARIEELKMLFR